MKGFSKDSLVKKHLNHGDQLKSKTLFQTVMLGKYIPHEVQCIENICRVGQIHTLLYCILPCWVVFHGNTYNMKGPILYTAGRLYTDLVLGLKAS